MTVCFQGELEFQGLNGRRVVADFEGGSVTGEAGGLLLREVEKSRRIVGRLAGCFEDRRDGSRIEHTLEQLLAQRVMALALGWEDLNDHDRLRTDPLIGVLSGKADPHVEQGAGKSTLNRLEHSRDQRYHKITWDAEKIDRLMVELFVESYDVAPQRIVLDMDATDDPVHGAQEGRFFHGYYDGYCYLPLYIFAGDHLLCARLRTSKIDACAGWENELPRIVEAIARRWPSTHILVRADSGFCRDALMAWCEDQKRTGVNVDYVFGLARNSRLLERISSPLQAARAMHQATGEAARLFHEFDYQTHDSWQCPRRVIAKAEWLDKGQNPRFIVTSLGTQAFPAQMLYEQIYCARGEAENRIKEQQLDLFADRTSTGFLQSNQLRLYFSSFAYILVNELRRLGLSNTPLAQATVATIRVKLLKIGAVIKVSCRRMLVSLSSGWPLRQLLAECLARLRNTIPKPLT